MSETNAINSTDAKRWVSEIERIDEEILSQKMSNAAIIKGMKDRKKETFERAEAAGLPLSALKLELFRREQDRKVKERESEAGEDKVELADMIRAALGDFASSPLGAAAVGAAEDEADLRSKRQREREESRQAEAAERLAGMQKPKRGRKKKGVELAGEDDGAPPMTGAEDDGAERLHGLTALN